jgi:hypothetical protein
MNPQNDHVQNCLVDGILPAGKVVILTGLPKTGKSSVALALAIRLMKGDPILQGDPDEPFSVMWLAGEDSLGEVIEPVLAASGVSCEVQGRRFDYATSKGDGLYFGPGELDLLRIYLDMNPDIRLVVIDSLSKWLEGGDGADYLAGPLRNLAHETGVVILVNECVANNCQSSMVDSAHNLTIERIGPDEVGIRPVSNGKPGIRENVGLAFKRVFLSRLEAETVTGRLLPEFPDFALAAFNRQEIRSHVFRPTAFTFWYGPGQFIRTKDRVKTFFAGMVHGYNFDQILNEYDQNAMLHLLCNHPEVFRKLEGGLNAFVVRANPKFNPRGLNRHRTVYVRHHDGSEDHFSVDTCIDGKFTVADIRQAFRREVESSVIGWKSRQFDDKGGRAASLSCPITGAPMTWNSCEVDHLPPWEFATLLKTFLEAQRIPLESVEITSRGPGDSGLKSRALAADWKMFHDTNATYRLLSVDGHRKLTAQRKAGQTVPNGAK